MTKRSFILALFILILIAPVVAQKQLMDSLILSKTVTINTELAGGHENNIFKSTDRYFDRTLSEYLPKDSLIKSDQFYDANLDVDYLLDLKKSVLDFSLDNWYRGYFSNNQLNQLKSRFKSAYIYNYSKTTLAGAEYQATYSDKIAVSTTGEELTRSFKYFENAGMVFFEHDFNRKNQLTIEYAIAHKKYVKEQLAYSLTNTESELNLLYKRRINKHKLYASLARANRKYAEYHATDQNGNISDQNPLRNFKYTDAGLKFRYYLSKNLTIIPELDYYIRKDKFEDYYSYKKIALGSTVKYSYKNLVAMAGIDYKHTKYDIKPAPSATSTDQLKYKYFYTNLNVAYQFNKKTTAFIDFESTMRDSNTELEYYRTLRPYNWYEMLVGIKYNVFM